MGMFLHQECHQLMTANEMKAKLDEKNIEYKTSDTKEILLS